MGLAQQQSKPSKKRAKTPAAPAAPVAIPVPFRSGEILEYRVLFSKYAVNAAKIETTVVEQRNFFGHRVVAFSRRRPHHGYHARALCH